MGKSDIEELTKALKKMKIGDDVHGRTEVTEIFTKMAIIGCKRKGDNNDGYGVAKKKISEVKEFRIMAKPEDDEKPVEIRGKETSTKMEVTGRKRRSNESDECGTTKKISESEKKRNNV